MKISIVDRIQMGLVITTLSLAGISMAADAPWEKHKRDQYEKQQQLKQKQQQERAQKKSAHEQKQQQHRAEQKQHQQEQKQKQGQRRPEQDNREHRALQQQQQERIERQSENIQQQQKRDAMQQEKQQQRLSRQRQQELIRQQQQHVARYRRHLEQQEHFARERAALLQQQKRMAQFRFQQQYMERVRRQQIHLRDHRFDYDRDPYFYTAPIYRYNRGGKYYETNEYGARALRRAVNYGYEEGFRAGKADRDDRWRSNYKDSYAYRDANYGYSGYYINRSDYNHYFREGLRRGYEDGYNSRYQHGRLTDGNPAILETILSQILNFQDLR